MLHAQPSGEFRERQRGNSMIARQPTPTFFDGDQPTFFNGS
jgi:hypothetical protein